MVLLTKKLALDIETAAQFEWNRGRRGDPLDTSLEIDELKYECMATSEAFEKRECLGKPTISIWNYSYVDMMNFLISNWVVYN